MRSCQNLKIGVVRSSAEKNDPRRPHVAEGANALRIGTALSVAQRFMATLRQAETFQKIFFVTRARKMFA
jgi:hypothetical protein